MSSDITAELKELSVSVTIAPPNRVLITVDSSRVVEAAQKLRALGFDHVKSVTGIDYPEQNKIDVVYHISSYADLELAKFLLEMRTSLNRAEPKVATLSKVWPSAEYLERETADLLGVVFEGQVAVGKLLLPENFEDGPPLRKDFKIKTEGLDA